MASTVQVTNRADRLHITFIDKDGDESTFEVAAGDNLLDIALENDIEMEGQWLLSDVHINKLTEY